MKRLWIALAILAVVFAGTMWHNYYLDGLTTGLSKLLTQAETQAEAGGWEAAQLLTDEAYDIWDQHETYLHVLLRHSDIDDILSGFREVQEFISCEEAGEYSAANARLITEIQLLYEAEELTLKNMF